MPLYIVSTGEGEAKKERLVEANNSPVARNFVARETVTVALATQHDLFRLAKAGVDIEVAKDVPASDGSVTGAEPEPEAQPEAGAETPPAEEAETEQPTPKRGK